MAGSRKDKLIFLTGFSYTGKTVVGKKVAESLLWGFIDIDDEIARIAGKSVSQVFSEDGEPHFRDLEHQVLQDLCHKQNLVISTGGGIVVAARNRSLILENGVVICLEARPETIYHRLVEQNRVAPGTARPLLNVADPLNQITTLKASRQQYYAIADWTVHTDEMTETEACREVLRGYQYISQKVDTLEFKDASCLVETSSGRYPVFIGWDCLTELPQRLRQVGLTGKVGVVCDDNVFSYYGSRVKSYLEDNRFTVHIITLPAGESTKNINNVSRLHDFFLERHFERDDIVLALGGGVVGDLAGFTAATLLRGVPLVQMPTSLLAMVDASVGGKTAVNHPRGKNLIGAFYQPRLVFIDVGTLLTLPSRELISGWAEVIKHAMILDGKLLNLLEENVAEIIKLEKEISHKVVECNIALKASVVSEDERETGRRIILNYGHTIAHGLEVATGYNRFLHGEAVALGMIGAAEISRRMGLLSEEIVQRQCNIIHSYGLSVGCSDISPEDVMEALEWDKKVRNKNIRWVLLHDIACPAIHDDVPREMVLGVLDGLLKGCS